MAMRDKFEELSALYSAIVDITNISSDENRSKTDKLDDAFNSIKNIAKDEFDDDYINRILNNIKEAMVTMYSKKSNEINSAIGLNHNSPFGMFGTNIRGEIAFREPPKETTPRAILADIDEANQTIALYNKKEEDADDSGSESERKAD